MFLCVFLGVFLYIFHSGSGNMGRYYGDEDKSALRHVSRAVGALVSCFSQNIVIKRTFLSFLSTDHIHAV